MASFSSLATSIPFSVSSARIRTRSRMPMTVVACAATDQITVSRKGFDSDFKFGAATAAYQVEGAVAEDGRGPCIWDTYIAANPDKIADKDNANVANDSYHYYMEDIKALKAMGMNSYRFSISWSRVLPKGTKDGGINQDGIKYYDNLINALKDNGIEPYVTLFHWDLPQTIESDHRGFLGSDIKDYFLEFVDLCFNTFGDRVKHWITLNEPYMYSIRGYDTGEFPPARCSYPEGQCQYGDSAKEPYTVTHNLIRSHAAAVNLYRTKYQEEQKGQIGITLNCNWYKPYSTSNDDQQAAGRALDFMLGWFMDPIVYGDYPFIMRALVGDRLPKFTTEEAELVKGSYDFIGLNYYTGGYAQSLTFDPSAKPISYSKDSYVNISKDRDGVPIGVQAVDNSNTGSWQSVYAKGIKELVLYVKNRYMNPEVYITENGYGQVRPAPETPKTEDDFARVDFYNNHLWELEDAIRMGANVKGFFAWALADCFEWTSGYTYRFGLCSIDRTKPTRDRHLKESAVWFSKFLKSN